VLDYDPDEVPEDAYALAIAYYDDEGSWVELPPDTGRVAEIGKATGLVNHFSTVGILAELTPPPPPALPANFVASNLSIVPSLVAGPEESVTISANVANDGEQEGSYIVELKINGETVDTEEVTLSAGENQQVSFALSGMDYGQYEVDVAQLNGEFTVSRSINWLLILGIIAAVALITGGVVWSRRRQKATRSE